MLGQRIAALRRQAGLNQAELARQLRVSPSAIGMYEQGRREPSLDTLVAMARIFGVSLDYLATGTAAAAPDPELMVRVEAARQRLERRQAEPFTRQELAVLFAAMLLETENG